jgi:arylsulfatase
MIAHWPAVIKDRNAVRKDLCHLIDVVPTLVSVSGGAYPKKFRGKRIATPVDGIDISTTFRGKPLPRERNLCFSYGGKAVVNGRWKAFGSGRKWRLYDFTRDRSEGRDVKEQHPDVLKRLIEEWEAYYKKNS